jgi:hypothetical protein
MFELMIVAFLIVLNGVFALSELAGVSARKARLENAADRGVAGAKPRLPFPRIRASSFPQCRSASHSSVLLQVRFPALRLARA